MRARASLDITSRAAGFSPRGFPGFKPVSVTKEPLHENGTCYSNLAGRNRGGGATHTCAAFTRAVSLLLIGVLGGTGCQTEPEATSPTSPATGRVYLLDAEQLEAPACGCEGSYRPAFIADDDQAAGFFLTVAAGDVDSVQLLLTNRDTEEVVSPAKVDPPATDAERDLAQQPRAFNPQAQAALQNDGAIFWVVADPAATASSTTRIAVVVAPSLLGSSTTLKLYTDRLPDGTIVGAAQLELVRDYFYLAVLGDSVLWGNGLREEDKASYLVARTLERETGKRVITQVHAHSGATITPGAWDGVCTANCTGEVPTVSTSVMLQAQQLEHPELLDLILLDGCINDVNVGLIIDPAASDEELLELTAQFCEEGMIALLEAVRAQAPQAQIVVTGYYQIVGPDSDLFGLERWIETQGVELTADQQEREGWLSETLARKSELFHSASTAHLQTAVQVVNAADSSAPLVAFADPSFGPENAIFTEESWLWSLHSDGELATLFDVDLDVFPEDPLFGYRAARCFEPDVLLGLVGCLFGSVGHPNPTGAEAYADAILNELQAFHYRSS